VGGKGGGGSYPRTIWDEEERQEGKTSKQGCGRMGKGNEVQKGRLRTCEDFGKRLDRVRGGKEKRLWVGCVFGGVILN